MHGRCDSRLTVTFSAADHYRLLAATKVYCLVTEAHGWTTCLELLLDNDPPGVELMTAWSKVRCSNCYATKPPLISVAVTKTECSTFGNVDRLVVVAAAAAAAAFNSKNLLAVHDAVYMYFNWSICWSTVSFIVWTSVWIGECIDVACITWEYFWPDFASDQHFTVSL